MARGIDRLYKFTEDARMGEPIDHNPECTRHAEFECLACALDLIRTALVEYEETPIRAEEIDAPCDCDPSEWTGRVSSEGFEQIGRGMSVSTCEKHLIMTQGYIQLATGKRASTLIPFAVSPGTPGVVTAKTVEVL